MSQSATLYRVSKEVFKNIEDTIDRSAPDIVSLAKEYSLFQGSFMAIEYMLSKGRDEETANLIKEIFGPSELLSISGFDEMTNLEKCTVYEEGRMVAYVAPGTVKRLNTFLKGVSLDAIDKKYDPDELNENDIYPWSWSNSTLPDVAYTKRDIVEGVSALKNIFNTAAAEEDYLLVFVG